MLANFFIGLREGLEAALVVGILIAYVVKSGRRDLLPLVWSGVAIAVLVSATAGAVLTFGPRGLSFEASEAIGGTLSIVAVALVTWMIFWMAKAARHMRTNLETALDSAIAMGKGAIVVMALLAVGREGLETAVFLWAGVNAAGSSTDPLVGAGLGILAAVILGWAIYRGTMRINLRAFFQWTGVFLIVVAAGVLAYGVHDLQEAGIVPGLNTLAFDVSAQVPPTSWYGTLLKGTLNFSGKTTVAEAIAWVCYTIPVMTLFIRMSFGSSPAPTAPSTEPHPRVTASQS